MPDQPSLSTNALPKDSPWQRLLFPALSFLFGLAINATINKFGAHWSNSVIVGLWLLPLLPLAGLAFFHEKALVSRVWLRSQYAAHPISSVLFLIFVLVLVIMQGLHIVHRLRKGNVRPEAATAPFKVLEVPKPSLPVDTKTELVRSTSLKKKARKSKFDTATVVQSGGGDGSCTQNIVSGNGNTNNCRPPQLILTEAQRKIIHNAMVPYAGGSVEVTTTNATTDSQLYGTELVETLVSAGMNAFYHPMMSTAACSTPGVVFTWKTNKAPFTDALRVAMESSGAVRGTIPEGKQGWIDPADLYVWICPYQ